MTTTTTTPNPLPRGPVDDFFFDHDDVRYTLVMYGDPPTAFRIYNGAEVHAEGRLERSAHGCIARWRVVAGDEDPELLDAARDAALTARSNTSARRLLGEPFVVGTTIGQRQVRAYFTVPGDESHVRYYVAVIEPHTPDGFVRCYVSTLGTKLRKVARGEVIRTSSSKRYLEFYPDLAYDARICTAANAAIASALEPGALPWDDATAPVAAPVADPPVDPDAPLDDVALARLEVHPGPVELRSHAHAIATELARALRVIGVTAQVDVRRTSVPQYPFVARVPVASRTHVAGGGSPTEALARLAGKVAVAIRSDAQAMQRDLEKLRHAEDLLRRNVGRLVVESVFDGAV